MTTYKEKILEGRKQQLLLIQNQEQELIRIYEEAGRIVTGKLAKAKKDSLTERQLKEIQKAISQYTDELRTKLPKQLETAMKLSSEIACAVQLSYFSYIDPEDSLKSTFIKMFATLPVETTKMLVAGDYYKDGLSLSNRIWNLTGKNASDIDLFIKANIAKGANARELAQALDNYVNPNSKKPPKTMAAKISKKISYPAQRLARTALTHAHNETYIQGSKLNPFAKGIKWNLSPSHYSRQIEKWGKDICDEYAEQNKYGLGIGIFPADSTPISHPNCLCYLTTVTEPIDKARNELSDWVNGGSNPKLDAWYEKNKHRII